MDCFKCNKRNDCREICEEVENQLPKMTEGQLPNMITLNNDYMDEVLYLDDVSGDYKFKKKERKEGF